MNDYSKIYFFYLHPFMLCDVIAIDQRSRAILRIKKKQTDYFYFLFVL